MGFWIGVLPFLWYLKFVMSEFTMIEKKKREFYAWGIIRYCFCALWFTVGNAFFLMDQNDWHSFYQSICDNVSKIIAGVFWLAFIFFIYYFFIRRYAKEKEKRGLVYPPEPIQEAHVVEEKKVEPKE